MDNIIKIKRCSLWVFIIPLLAINLCLIIVTNFHGIMEPGGAIHNTIPYIDGGASISRTARFYPTYLIFKPAMFLTSVLLFNYWQSNYRLMSSISNDYNYKKYFRFFGITSAAFLILHSIFLGVNLDLSFYKIFRRLVILSFIIFELTAQVFLVINIYKVKSKIITFSRSYILKAKIILVTILVVVAIVSIPVVTSDGNKYVKHMLEWNFFVAVISFYLLSFLFWNARKT